MNENDTDRQRLQQTARRLLQDSETAIDPLSVARLAAARRRAVAALRTSPPWWRVLSGRWPALAGATALALLLVGVLPRNGALPGDADGIDYAVTNDAAIYEHLEFYLWADELDSSG